MLLLRWRAPLCLHYGCNACVCIRWLFVFSGFRWLFSRGPSNAHSEPCCKGMQSTEPVFVVVQYNTIQQISSITQYTISIYINVHNILPMPIRKWNARNLGQKGMEWIVTILRYIFSHRTYKMNRNVAWSGKGAGIARVSWRWWCHARGGSTHQIHTHTTNKKTKRMLGVTSVCVWVCRVECK